MAQAFHESQVYKVSNVKTGEMSALEIVLEMVGRERALADELLTMERAKELPSERHEWGK